MQTPARLRILIFLLLSIGYSHFSAAQSFKIDSLKSLSARVSGKEQADILNLLAFELLSYDNTQAKRNAENAFELSEKLNYTKGKAEALIFIGVVDVIAGDIESSFVKLKKSISLSEKSKMKGLQGYGLTYLGSNYESTNQRDSALLCYNKAFDLLKDINEPYYLSFLYLYFADYYKINNQSDLQLEYLKKCWAIRENFKEKKYLVWIGHLLASFYTETGDYQEAFSYLKKGQDALGKDTVDNEEISFIYKQKALIYINKGNYESAFKLLGKANKYFERSSDQLELADIQSEVGYIFMDIANFELALKNYFEALSRAQKYKYELAETKLLFRIAWVYYQLKQDKQSEEYIKKSLQLAKTNFHKSEEGFALNLLGLLADRQDKNGEAFEYFNQALTIRRSINYKNGIASTLLNIGSLLEKEKKYSLALNYNIRSLEIEESTGHSVGQAYCYQGLGQLYCKMKEFTKADSFLTKAEVMSKKIKAGNILMDVFKSRKDLLISQKKYQEALAYVSKYDMLKDSVFNQNLSSNISVLQNIFLLRQKDNEITILSQQKELQQKKLEIQSSKIEEQQNIILVGAVGILLICVITYIIYKYYTRVRTLNREISERNEEIQAQSEELTESNQRLAKLNREIQEKNEEVTTQSEELKETNEVLLRLNVEVNEQKEEIQAQSEELSESYQIIAKINDSLEERIEERTAQLKQAYKELDTFFYRSSHDFRRPLTTFMGLAEVAKITVKDGVALELFDKVNETARNLDKMLMKLQSISDVGVQESLYKQINIYDAFKLELDLFNSELLQKGVQTKIEVEDNLHLQSYPALVKIILVNLIENAIAFRGFYEPIILLKAYQKENLLIIEVTDNGQGIEPELTSRVFDMYFRGSENSKGNGLGLYIVKKAADKLQAIVRLESEVGKTTTVTIAFPNQLKTS